MVLFTDVGLRKHVLVEMDLSDDILDNFIHVQGKIRPRMIDDMRSGRMRGWLEVNQY